MMKEAVKLVLREKTLFDVIFLDGVVKRYDILSLADKFPQLNQLKDRSLFEKGHILGWGGVIWNDELDVSVDTVYEDGIDVTNEYDYDEISLAILGYKIKDIRLGLFMSQEDLAKKTGIDQSDLSKIEKGLLNPSIKLINRIAKGLGTKVEILFK